MIAQPLADMVCKSALCSYKKRESVQLASFLVGLRTECATNNRATTEDEKEQIALRAKEAEMELFNVAPNMLEKDLQHDANEGYQYLINDLQNDEPMCNHCENFKIQLSTLSYCRTCGMSCEPYEKITTRYDLGVVIAQSARVKLHDLLEEFFQPRILIGGYRRPFGSCHREEQKYVFQRYMFKQVPVQLYVPLGRFTAMSYTGVTKKITTKVDFPMVLDLSHYMVPAHSKENCKLILTGVIWHSGSAEEGHYTTSTWVPQIKQWVYFDDMDSESPTLEKGKWWEARQRNGTVVTSLLYSRSLADHEIQNEPCLVCPSSRGGQTL
jgi:hypothetical protein